MPNFADIAATEEWQQLALPAEQYYTYELPYHNWDHAQHVARTVVELGIRCRERGLDVDIGMVAVAAAWHDAGYQHDHQSVGQATKELYSALLAEQFLTSQGVPVSYVREVQQAILGTTHQTRRRGWNMLLLHRADIADIAADYDLFAANSYKLWQEKTRRDPDADFGAWQKQNATFLTTIVDESPSELTKLRQTPTQVNDFCRSAQRNIDGLLAESVSSLQLHEEEAA